MAMDFWDLQVPLAFQFGTSKCLLSFITHIFVSTEWPDSPKALCDRLYFTGLMSEAAWAKSNSRQSEFSRIFRFSTVYDVYNVKILLTVENIGV
jgi:hypothetical protein